MAFGGAFFQLASQPLAINIGDLTWSDYDPDGEPIFFVGASATTSNGLPLTTRAGQVLLPTNSLADGFSYTIADTRGVTATGTATVSIIARPESLVSALDLSWPGGASVTFTGVPWYYYTAQRATNAAFTGTLQTWPVQAWADGSIYLWDAFADLPSQPPHAFYRLSYP